MKRSHALQCCIAGMVLAAPGLAFGQIYAMMNYETKSPDSLKVLKTPVPTGARKEGIKAPDYLAVIDVDPQSKTFGKIVQDMPIPPDVMAHHLFYNRDQTKIYVTSLGKGQIRVIDMKKTPYAMKVVEVPDCQVGEDVVFSDDNKTWYLSCMGNQTVVIGDATTDKPTKSVKVGVPYPHGVAVAPSIDRMLTTGTVRASDGGDAGEMISEVQLSTGKVVNSYKVSNKPSPSGEAPVEVLFVPGVNPPLAYVTNLYGGTLWMMRWNTDKKAFDVSQAHDFAAQNSGVPLEMYFSKSLDRMYVTTGKPGSGRGLAPHRLHQGWPLRVRAERAPQPAGTLRRLDHGGRHEGGQAGREHGHAQAEGHERELRGAAAPVERREGALTRP